MKGMFLDDWFMTDPNDERVIHYELTCKHWSGEYVLEFTSNDSVPPRYLQALKGSRLTEDAKLVNNEWFVKVEYYSPI